MFEKITTKLTVWAYKNRYCLGGDDPEFSFTVRIDDAKPYYDGAFAVKDEEVTIQFELPTDTVTPQVKSLLADQKEARLLHCVADRLIDDKIQALLALPAPE